MAEGREDSSSDYKSEFTESDRALTQTTSGLEDFDILLGFHENSNLKQPVKDAKSILESHPYTVKDSTDVFMDCGKLKATLIESHIRHSKFRIFIINKAFVKHDLGFYKALLCNGNVTNNENTLILSRAIHRKKIPREITSPEYHNLTNRMTGKEIADQILAFVAKNKSSLKQGIAAGIQDIAPGIAATGVVDRRKMQEYKAKKEQFFSMVDRFNKKRVFILVACVNSVNVCLKSIARIPWLKVFDFYPESEKSGLLSTVKDCLPPGKFSISSVTDKPIPLTGKQLDWTLHMKIENESDSRDHRRDHISALSKYCSGHKLATLLILWYSDCDESTEFALSDFLSTVRYAFKRDVKYVLSLPAVPESGPMNMISRTFVKDNRVVAPVDKVCEWIEELAYDITLEETDAIFLLPKNKEDADSPDTFVLEQENLNWLEQDMSVLVFCAEGRKYRTDNDKLKERGIDFLKGGDFHWDVIEDGGYDLRRDIMQSIIDHISFNHMNEGNSGIVTVYHAPGSGGTTLSRRILWEFRKIVPCLALDSKSEINDDLQEKIKLVREKSELPVLVLVDGRSSQEVRNLQYLCRYERIIILHVLRFYSKKILLNHGRFYLPDQLSKKEAAGLEKILIKHGPAGIRKRMGNLTNEVEANSIHTVFEYGLTAFHSNFKGVRKYVESHLVLSDGHEQWHEVVAFLSLAKYYANCSIPPEFFSSILAKEQYCIVDLQMDIPEWGQQLISEGEEEWKIPHYMIAREILEQYLTGRNKDVNPVGLSTEACGKLDTLALRFLTVMKNHLTDSDQISQLFLNLLMNLFIIRNDERSSDTDDYGTKSKFSRLIMDIGEAEKQEKVFQNLVANFTSDAELHAHFGRFLGKINKHREAVISLDKAVAIREQYLKSSGRPVFASGDDVLCRIHSMFGFVYNAYMKFILGNERVGYITKSTYSKITMENAKEMLNTAIQAVQQFQKCRSYYCPSVSPSYGYIGELQVRFHLTEFASKRTEYDLMKLKEERNAFHFLYDFVCESFSECDNLLDQCIRESGESDVIQREVVKYLNLFQNYYRQSTFLNKWMGDGNTLLSKQCRITLLKMKLKGQNKRDFRVYEDLGGSKNLSDFIELIEDLVHDSSNTKILISSLMENWINAIRLENRSKQKHNMDKVRHFVDIWDGRHERGSKSTFYRYVLQFMIALFPSPPDEAAKVIELKEKVMEGHFFHARHFLEKPLEQVKVIQPGSFPTINMLVNYEERKLFGVHEGFLHVFTGKIVNIAKAWNGIINVDLSHPGRFPMEVFFAPKKFKISTFHAKQRSRVEFHIGFNIKHGAQAYDVRLLKNTQCRHCSEHNEIVTLLPCPYLCWKCNGILVPV